jgi:hypothetical protein
MKLFGATVDTASASPWILALALAVIGGIAFRHAKKRFALAWGEANRDIEDMIRRTA